MRKALGFVNRVITAKAAAGVGLKNESTGVIIAVLRKPYVQFRSSARGFTQK
jgi:hypothetical protein